VQVIDGDWAALIAQEAAESPDGFDIACPFVKSGAVASIFANTDTNPRRLLTRFNLRDMLNGVHDLEALDRLRRGGVEVRGVRDLHAKVFLSRGRSVLIGSVNLTTKALERNHEFGVLLRDEDAVLQTEAWFDALWTDAGPSLTKGMVAEIRNGLSAHQPPRPTPSTARGLEDFGAVIGQGAGPDAAPRIDFPGDQLFQEDAPQFLVKFLGTASERAALDEPVYEHLNGSGAHWSLHYSLDRRPREVVSGAVAFVARLVNGGDYGAHARIFGRVRVSQAHVDGRDDATPEEIDFPDRAWKARWPHYVRVHGGQFLDGVLGDGVPLQGLLADMGADFLAPEKRTPRIIENPRLALVHAPHIVLSTEGFRECNRRLEAAFAEHGMISDRQLAQLDWPEWVHGDAP